MQYVIHYLHKLNRQNRQIIIKKSMNAILLIIIVLKNEKCFIKILTLFAIRKMMKIEKNMVKSRTEYENAVRNINYEMERQKSFKLLNVIVKNAKEYWKLLKSSVVHPNAKYISLVDFEDYFKSVNNPEDAFFQPDEDIIYFKERSFKFRNTNYVWQTKRKHKC